MVIRWSYRYLEQVRSNDSTRDLLWHREDSTLVVCVDSNQEPDCIGMFLSVYIPLFDIWFQIYFCSPCKWCICYLDSCMSPSTVMYKSWNITQILVFKLKYILNNSKLLQNCNLLLMMILLVSLAIKRMKILFCNTIVKHLILKKWCLLGHDAVSLGERLHCFRGR